MMPITMVNITAQGLTLGTMTLKASKSMDQQFCWLNAAVGNDSSYTYGAAASSIAPTTPVNTMHPSIIKLFAHSIFSICWPHSNFFQD
jgi:hypothetical protein